jgi:hypothetical protein
MKVTRTNKFLIFLNESFHRPVSAPLAVISGHKRSMTAIFGSKALSKNIFDCLLLY